MLQLSSVFLEEEMFIFIISFYNCIRFYQYSPDVLSLYICYMQNNNQYAKNRK